MKNNNSLIEKAQKILDFFKVDNRVTDVKQQQDGFLISCGWRKYKYNNVYNFLV